jgi:hypothetical protein
MAFQLSTGSVGRAAISALSSLRCRKLLPQLFDLVLKLL